MVKKDSTRMNMKKSDNSDDKNDEERFNQINNKVIL
jgi:hypothetical protein